MTVYSLILALHNIMRWVVLVLAVLALYRSISGWLQKKDWIETDRKVGVFFGISIDIQLLLGLILYLVISPWGIKAVVDQGMAYVMGNSAYRFFVVEHIFYMILAMIFAHLGSILPKKVQDAAKKHQRAAIFFILAVVVILMGIPWGRPLFPGL